MNSFFFRRGRWPAEAAPIPARDLRLSVVCMVIAVSWLTDRFSSAQPPSAPVASTATFADSPIDPSDFPVTIRSAAAPTASYRFFRVEQDGERVVATEPILEDRLPRWARDVNQQTYDWSGQLAKWSEPIFAEPLVYVRPPEDDDEPFYSHNHQPAISWLPNGDLLAIWYSTREEVGTELTVLASRLRAGQEQWDAASEFFKVEDRNMHGSSLILDRDGQLHHLNGMGPAGGRGWALLTLLARTSRDHGQTWTAPVPIGPQIKGRHQVIAGGFQTRDGRLIQPCDAVPGGEGGTAIHISHDGGWTWHDPGADAPPPSFGAGQVGQGTIAGIHAGVVELSDGRLMALGRGDNIDGRMPMSISSDGGQTWEYRASPFPPVGGGQRLVLKRLQEGPLLLIAFTSANRREPEANGMTFVDAEGNRFTGHGMYAALSFDDGASWPVRKLLTPGAGELDGGGHTKIFTATPSRAEHAGYLAATQSPDGVIHLISSRLHYRFNLPWLTAGVAPQAPAGELQSFLGPSRFDGGPLFDNQRFPNLVVNIDGSLLATWGSQQVISRRSEDGGETWGATTTIADPGFQGGGTTVDTLTGDVLAFVEAHHPPAPLTVYRSRDFGQTWQPQSDLRLAPNQLGHLPSMHMNEHGLTLRYGPHAGRLIRPSRYYADGNDSAYWAEHYTNAIYSDDGGYSWQTSEPFPEMGTGEAAIAELSSGQLYYNSRVHWPERPDNTRRRSALSLDGGHSWDAWRLVAALPDGRQDRAYGCMGGLVRLPLAERDVLIYSNLDTDRSVRERITVWASFDGGHSWPIKRLVDAGPSAYSCLAVGRPGTPSDGWIYLHYESGGGSQLARFNLTWLLEGEATGDGELPTLPAAAQPAASPVTDPIYVSLAGSAPSQPLFVESDHLRVGIDVAIGGAVTHVSAGDGPNLINSHDLGRQIQQSYYSGPGNYQRPGKEKSPNWASFPWNPIQTGDAFGNGSQVLEHRIEGRSLYVKTIPMLWPMNDDPGECVMETWIDLDPDRPQFRYRARLTNQRQDQTYYGSFAQEIPAVYTNGPWHRLVTYLGASPFEGEEVTEVRNDHQEPWPWVRFAATEGWAALLDDQSQGLGVVVAPGMEFHGGFHGRRGEGGPKSGPTGYMSPITHEILDHNIVLEYECLFVVGSLDEIRQVAIDRRPAELPRWDFSSDRQSWTIEGGRDGGWPIDAGGLVLQADAGRSQLRLVSPFTFWQADQAAQLAIRLSSAEPGRLVVGWRALPPRPVSTGNQWGAWRQQWWSADRASSADYPAANDHWVRVRLSGAESYTGSLTGLAIDLPAGVHVHEIRLLP